MVVQGSRSEQILIEKVGSSKSRLGWHSLEGIERDILEEYRTREHTD